MIAEKTALIVSELNRKEREIFLLCLADEVPDEEKASWLRSSAWRLAPIGLAERREYWWFLDYQGGVMDNLLHPFIHDKLAGKRSDNPRFPAVFYKSPAEAWADLFRVLFQDDQD